MKSARQIRTLEHFGGLWLELKSLSGVFAFACHLASSLESKYLCLCGHNVLDRHHSGTPTQPAVMTSLKSALLRTKNHSRYFLQLQFWIRGNFGADSTSESDTWTNIVDSCCQIQYNAIKTLHTSLQPAIDLSIYLSISLRFVVPLILLVGPLTMPQLVLCSPQLEQLKLQRTRKRGCMEGSEEKTTNDPASDSDILTEALAAIGVLVRN
eukprot:3300046-Amphidinium_carterae.1